MCMQTIYLFIGNEVLKAALYYSFIGIRLQNLLVRLQNKPKMNLHNIPRRYNYI